MGVWVFETNALNARDGTQAQYTGHSGTRHTGVSRGVWKCGEDNKEQV